MASASTSDPTTPAEAAAPVAAAALATDEPRGALDPLALLLAEEEGTAAAPESPATEAVPVTGPVEPAAPAEPVEQIEAAPGVPDEAPPVAPAAAAVAAPVVDESPLVSPQPRPSARPTTPPVVPVAPVAPVVPARRPAASSPPAPVQSSGVRIVGPVEAKDAGPTEEPVERPAPAPQPAAEQAAPEPPAPTADIEDHPMPLVTREDLGLTDAPGGS